VTVGLASMRTGIASARELKEALTPSDHALLAAVYGFDGPPNFEHDRYVLHLPEPLAERARASGWDRGGAAAEARSGAPRPARGALRGGSGPSWTTRS